MNTRTSTHPALTESEVRAFFEAFVDAFALFDGYVIAQRYMAPYLSADASGALRLFSYAEQIGAYFEYHRPRLP